MEKSLVISMIIALAALFIVLAGTNLLGSIQIDNRYIPDAIIIPTKPAQAMTELSDPIPKRPSRRANPAPIVE